MDTSRNEGATAESLGSTVKDARVTAKEAWSTPLLTRLNVSQTEANLKATKDADTTS